MATESFFCEINNSFFAFDDVNYVSIDEEESVINIGYKPLKVESSTDKVKMPIQDFERLREALKASSVMVKCSKNDYVNGYKVSLSKFLSDRDRFDIHFTDGMEHYKYVQFTKPKKTLKRLSEMRVF